jgi:phosphoglycolate phosphatase-like HAD superfamily hydrolase
MTDMNMIIMAASILNHDLLIQDSLTFVKKQYELGTRMHIVSGSDQTELSYLCNELDLAHYFVSIHGSPTPKAELAKQVLEANAYTKKDVVLIGDSMNDYNASMRNTIDFVRFNYIDLRQVYIEYIEKNNKAIVK